MADLRDQTFTFTTELGLAELWKGIIADGEKAISESWDALPNVFKAADILFRFVSGVAGRVLTLPLLSIVSHVRKETEKRGGNTRVVSETEAMVWPFLALAEWWRSVLLLGDQSLLQFFVGAFAGFVYRTVKRIVLLRNLLAAQTEFEFVEAVLRAFRSRVFTTVWIAVVVAILFVFATLGVVFCYAGLFWHSGVLKTFGQTKTRRRLNGPYRTREASAQSR